LIAGLAPHIRRGTRQDVDAFTAAIVAKMTPPPRCIGLDHLPENPRFLLVANHYQRKGLWILHSAAALTQAVRCKYGPGEPPVRWVVTANWPAVKMGPLQFPSPGDWLLPRVAHALHCYPVSLARTDPASTARSLRRLLRDAAGMDRPIALFPEGAAGMAGTLSPPLPGVERLVCHLARKGFAAVPAGISEDGGFVICFGPAIPAAELLVSPHAAELLMRRIGDLTRTWQA
jgi:hypothetical protein